MSELVEELRKRYERLRAEGRNVRAQLAYEDLVRAEQGWTSPRYTRQREQQRRRSK